MNRLLKNLKRLCSIPLLLAVAAGMPLMINTASAVDDVGLFELEGNAQDDSVAGSPDDWDTYPSPQGGAFVFTGIKADPAPISIFDGGKKDIQDVTSWSGKNGSVPDKDDITNAYAAAYKCPAGETDCTENDLIVYFGADRFSNVGDAFLGFWFFKGSVTYDSDTGDFSGSHQNGDTNVLVNFPQGANDEPEIQVIKWDTSCNKADSNSPSPGECAAKNLRLIADASGASAVCDPGGTMSNTQFCAIANTEGGPYDPAPSPWDYKAKDGSVDSFPYESFYEGGINLTKVIGGDACFASFMAESRSSSSFTASLKDFVLDAFPVCAVELSKQCGTGTFNPTTGNLDIPYSVTVKNTGQATVNSIVASDDDCGYGNGTQLTFGSLLAGASDTKQGTCSLPAGTDLTSGVVNGVSAVADNGEVSVILADSCTTDSSTPGTCYSACSFNLSPQIAVSKSCKMRLALDDDSTPSLIKLQSHIMGTVTNTSDQKSCNVNSCDTDNNLCTVSGSACISDADCDTAENFCSPGGDQCTADADCTAQPVPLENVAAENDLGTIDTSDDVALTLYDTCSSGFCDISGQVCTEDTDCDEPTTLEPGQSAYYMDVYDPTGLNDTCPARASFSDTVTAAGDDVFTGQMVSDMATATCELCNEDDCPPLQ